MFQETPRISLTIKLEGSHKPRFVFDKNKKNKDGSIGGFRRYFGKVVTNDDTGLKTFVPAKTGKMKAFQHRDLCEDFVINAIREPVQGYNKKKWHSLPMKERVNKHVRNLVKDMFDLDYIDHTVYQWEFVPEIK